MVFFFFDWLIDFYLFFPYCFKFLLFLLLLFRINFSLKHKRLSTLQIFFRFVCFLSLPFFPNFCLKCFVIPCLSTLATHQSLAYTEYILPSFLEIYWIDVVTAQKTKKWLTNSFTKAQNIFKLAFKTSYTTAQKKFQSSLKTALWHLKKIVKIAFYSFSQFFWTRLDLV